MTVRQVKEDILEQDGILKILIMGYRILELKITLRII